MRRTRSSLEEITSDRRGERPEFFLCSRGRSVFGYMTGGPNCTRTEYQRRYVLENKEKIQEYKKKYYRTKIEHARVKQNLPVKDPYRSWKTLEELRSFLDSLAGKLYVEAPEDWYRVSSPQVRKYGGLY
jgi:hypothetical protein